ncbi:transmembrane protein 132E [Echinococcus multilocularis]|uniref:Transmembrane protein 132E n=1 Tax=Echinococcus multilocularis TaxID=6211 RepID=A0A068YB72_ECHMU|nr:transmembrane protein 132E [Echinococcus multilocularis]
MAGGRETFFLIWVGLFVTHTIEIDVINTGFVPNRAAFFVNTGSTKETSIYMQDFASVGNIDDVSLNINVGNLRVNASINPDANNFHGHPLTTVHLFQKELGEDDLTLHFLCHSLMAPDLLENLNNQHLSTCCIIKVIASNRHFFTGCLIDNLSFSNRSACHASIQIESRAWNDSMNNELDVSYRINTVQYVKSSTVNLLMDSAALSRQCWTPLATQMSNFKFLSKISLKKPQRDEIREIGRNIRLDIPSRRLKNGEYFNVPVRVKQHTSIAEFTLRCEIPSKTYIEFVRVVWPWEVDESSSNIRETNARLSQMNNGFSAWDISQRHIPSLKGNVTEVVARYRESAIDPSLSDHFRDDPIIYKLLFRVAPPPKDAVGRIGPRFLWSLVSLSRRNTVDQSASGSPIVTRLNIESFEFKHLALVIKSTSLVNTAVLSGYPTHHPVWVFGLTHGHELRDVTAHSTCHTNDESVAHFPRESCSAGLTFSGGELGGSGGLTLVAKVDRTSAAELVTVWFPQQPHGVYLVIENPREGPTSVSSTSAAATGTHLLHEYSTTSIMLRSLADSQQAAQLSSSSQMIASIPHFQQTRLRVFARFTAANTRITSAGEYSHSSSEEVSISPPLDVTDLTAHCLRLEFTNDVAAALSIDDDMTTPARLVLVGKRKDAKGTGDAQTATRVWLVGQRPGRVRVRLVSVADSSLVRAALPTSLARLRKQQNQEKRSGSGATWDRQQFQTLWVTVTANGWVWPVGITAQLVTDLTVTVTQQERSEGNLPSRSTASYHQSLDREKAAESGFTFYTAHIRFSGSRVGRSKGVPMTSNSGGATSPDAFAFQQRSQFPLLQRVKRQLVTKTLPRQGLLVVTVQFSDGSVLPWHRIMEVVWELGESTAPFTLAVENLRPDLVRVDMPPLPPPPAPPPSRRKRSVGPRWFTFHHDVPATMETKNKTQKAQQRPEWLGPTVFLLREDESFIGDLLRVNLRSNIDNSLLFSAPVHASIVAARPSRRRGEDEVREGAEGAGGERLQRPNHWEGQKTSATHVAVEGLRHLPSQFWPNPEVEGGTHDADEDDNDVGGGGGNPTDDQLDNIAETSAAAASQMKRVDGRGWNPLSEPLETQQKPSAYDLKLAELFGSPALKDAPGMRSTSPYQRPLHPDPVDKASAKKMTKEKDVFVDRPNADISLNEAAVKSSEGSESGGKGSDDPVGAESGHRPALELIMYILLGLFILIALIFAVNCGAMVARYRWEHARGVKENLRLQHLSELAMSNANTDVSGMGECSSSSTADPQSQADQVDTLQDGMSGGQKAASHYGCITAFATLRRKFGLWSLSQHRINRDNDWIWLSRDALAESQHDHGNNSNLNGPRLNTVTTALELSKHPSLSKPPLTPTIPPSSTASVCDSNNPRLVVTSTAQQKPPLVSSYHASSPRVPLAKKTSVSASATCHYEGEECSIRILTNTVEPEKSKMPTSRRGIPSALISSQHLHSRSAGSRQNSQFSQSHHHHRGHHQGQQNFHHPHLDQRRCSAFVFGQSLILDHQNPDWKFSADCGFSHHHLQSQRCYCSRGLVSPWRYRDPPQPCGTSGAEEDKEGGVIPAVLSFEGYQTLPSHIPAWQDGGDCGTPPCPPVRTSSKLKPPLLISHYGQQNSPSLMSRPTSFPNKSMLQQEPLLATSVTNEVYSLLAGSGGVDANGDGDEATLTRQSSAHSHHPVQTTTTNSTELPRQTSSYSRIDTSNQTTTTTMTPGSRRSSTRGPPEAQSVSAGSYYHQTAYANCRPASLTPTAIQSNASKPGS